MNIEAIRQKMRALIDDDSRRSETSRLREAFEEIQEALTKGVRYPDVHRALNECGFNLSLAGLKSAMQRIRRERGHLPSRNIQTGNSGPTPAEGGAPTSQAGDGEPSSRTTQADPSPPQNTILSLASKEQRERKADLYIPGPNLDHFRKEPQ